MLMEKSGVGRGIYSTFSSSVWGVEILIGGCCLDILLTTGAMDYMKL